ncbi:MAG: hypothetical protein AAF750_07870 [Planctomycetota bacterium]
MGAWYCNFTAHGVPASGLAQTLSDLNRQALVAPTQKGNTVFYDEEAEELDDVVARELATRVSRKHNCPVLISAVADDDELWLCLIDGDDVTFNYSSRGRPDKASTLASAFGRKAFTPLLWIALKIPYVAIESSRHGFIATLLGLPAWASHTGYRYAEEGDLGGGITKDDLIRVSPKP